MNDRLLLLNPRDAETDDYKTFGLYEVPGLVDKFKRLSNDYFVVKDEDKSSHHEITTFVGVEDPSGYFYSLFRIKFLMQTDQSVTVQAEEIRTQTISAS
mmetsp:Transcript_26736/g.40797  ORF Transcript_26736/g.40797 Transcript_26736/m.40797 type:complete len:99 (-) Transcript_26736:51-347(-)